jgi:uncharacterized membrane protein YdjX (TVP38/TMEM64 family)
VRLIGPHNLLNLGLATSTLRLRDFVVGTAIGSAPTIVLATVGGALAPDAASLWKARDAIGLYWVPLVVAGAIAMIAAIVMVRRATLAALARHTEARAGLADPPESDGSAADANAVDHAGSQP